MAVLTLRKTIKGCKYKVSHLNRKTRGEDGAPAFVIKYLTEFWDRLLDQGADGWYWAIQNAPQRHLRGFGTA